jgi:hypothetical protein
MYERHCSSCLGCEVHIASGLPFWESAGQLVQRVGQDCADSICQHSKEA